MSPKKKQVPGLLPEDLEALLHLTLARQLELAETLESHALAIREHVHKLQARKKRHRNGH